MLLAMLGVLRNDRAISSAPPGLLCLCEEDAGRPYTGAQGRRGNLMDELE